MSDKKDKISTNKRIDNFLIFDFETSGVDCQKNLALEFAGIWIDGYDFREIDRVEFLINIYSDDLIIEQKALDKNGIDLEEVLEKGVQLEEAVQLIIEKTEKCNEGKMRGKKTILVGQNVLFDIGFLQQIFKLTKKDLSKLFTGGFDYFGNFIPAHFDTLYLGRVKHSQNLNMTTFNLNSLCKQEKIDLVGAHRAMVDVESTLALFVKYMQGVKSGGESSTYNFRENFKFQLG